MRFLGMPWNPWGSAHHTFASSDPKHNGVSKGNIKSSTDEGQQYGTERAVLQIV